MLITGRAPHPGRTHNEGKAFWLNISEISHRKATGWPVIFCGDANAHVGEIVTNAVGPLAPAPENQAGQLFHNWLLAHQLFLPATLLTHIQANNMPPFAAPTMSMPLGLTTLHCRLRITSFLLPTGLQMISTSVCIVLITKQFYVVILSSALGVLSSELRDHWFGIHNISPSSSTPRRPCTPFIHPLRLHGGMLIPMNLQL